MLLQPSELVSKSVIAASVISGSDEVEHHRVAFRLIICRLPWLSESRSKPLKRTFTQKRTYLVPQGSTKTTNASKRRQREKVLAANEACRFCARITDRNEVSAGRFRDVRLIGGLRFWIRSIGG